MRRQLEFDCDAWCIHICSVFVRRDIMTRESKFQSKSKTIRTFHSVVYIKYKLCSTVFRMCICNKSTQKSNIEWAPTSSSLQRTDSNWEDTRTFYHFKITTLNSITQFSFYFVCLFVCLFCILAATQSVELLYDIYIYCCMLYALKCFRVPEAKQNWTRKMNAKQLSG